MKYEDDTTKQIIRFLDEGTAALDDGIADRLAAARHRAVAALEQRVRTTRQSPQSLLTRLWQQCVQHHRAVVSTAAVCSAVFVAFLVTQQFSDQDVMGQGDAFLLASELPPEAYLDKGFDVWLERTSKQ